MASKQISYCSLEEAWNGSYPVMYSKTDNMLTAMPSNDIDIDGTILNDRSLGEKNSFEDYYMKIKDKIVDTKIDDNKKDCSNLTCDNFLNHYIECNDCKDKINKILNIKDKGVIENFSLMDDGYMDILILVLIGIFVIFVLDCFVKLGRRLK